MADMAPMEDVEDAWEDLQDVLGDHGGISPVTYMNSIAGIKALCGRNNGAVCTSSNAPAVLRWAFENAERVLFLPDQHLGRNTALKLGIPLDEMVVWNPFKRMGGNTPEQLRKAKMVLWQGHCSVHTRFTAAQDSVGPGTLPGHQRPGAPGVPDGDGAGRRYERLHRVHPQGHQPRRRRAASGPWALKSAWSTAWRSTTRTRRCSALDPVSCPCSTMYRIHPAYLLWVLDGLAAGQVTNQITVPEDVRREATIALERMLALR